MAVAQSFGGGDSHAIANWMVDATEQWILENSKFFFLRISDFINQLSTVLNKWRSLTSVNDESNMKLTNIMSEYTPKKYGVIKGTQIKYGKIRIRASMLFWPTVS